MQTKIPKFFDSSVAANYLVATILVAVPFHAFLTVWGSSLVGYYTALRLWDNALLLVLLGIVGWWIVRDRSLRVWLAGSLLVRLIAAYAALSVLIGLIALAKGEVTVQALGYGLLVHLRFLGWFLAVVLVVRRSAWLRRVWPRLLLFPALIVVIFATLQYTVLPHDFLSHFGYNKDATIAPINTINHNPAYIRVQSFLRGPNVLGAYLVVVLSALAVLFVRGRRRLACAAFGALGLFALYASGSRSAWIGTFISLAVVAVLCVRRLRTRLLVGAAAAGVVVLGAIGFLVFQHNEALQNAVLHTEYGSAITVDSNEAHADALTSGVSDLWHQPFGDGPGTAGPASQHNSGHSPRIAENYFVQIAQETGWLGLALLISIMVLVAVELYTRTAGSRLALMLFASLIGVLFVSLLSHAWTDDTLAYAWWGLAGIAVGAPANNAGAARAAGSRPGRKTVKTRETGVI